MEEHKKDIELPLEAPRNRSCRIIRLAKSKSQFRLIYNPNYEYKRYLKSLLPTLEKILENLNGRDLNYAFSHGRNSALNAFQHIGHRYTLSLDLKDFFDSIRKDHVSKLIPSNIIEHCFVDGAPRQGLPTSPIISSIAFSACDQKILKSLKSFKLDATYTRYADDLIFSFKNKADGGKISTLVRHALSEHGFHINERKTKLQDIKNGRVIITGIAIDSNGLHPTRTTLKRIRAAKHQNNKPSFTGLEEWSKCKFPKRIKHE